MKTLILHIGAHKTGSSSIQYFLKQSRSELQTKGWAFVHLRGALNLGQLIGWKTNGATEFFFREEPYSKFIEKLADVESNCIASCEDMFFITDKSCISNLEEDLRTIFNRIMIIVYLRRQDSMAVSQKAQGAKTVQSSLIFGNTTSSLPELTAPVRDYLEYDRKIEKWSTIFGKENLHIRIFERDRLVDGDAVTDFLTITKLPLTPRKIKENLSLDSKTTSFLYLLRAKGIGNSVIWPLYKSHTIQRNFGRPALPSREQARQFLESFEDSNRRLSELFKIDRGFDSDMNKYPEEAEVYSVDLTYSIRNCRRSIELMRKFCNQQNCSFLQQLITSTDKAHLQLDKALGPITEEMRSAIEGADKLNQGRSSKLSMQDDDFLLDQLVKEIKTLGKVANTESAVVLHRTARRLASEDLCRAYKLTRIASLLLPNRPVIYNELSRYRAELWKQRKWSLASEFAYLVDKAVLYKNMARSKIMTLLG